MKRLFSLILALAMLSCCFVGCDLSDMMGDNSELLQKVEAMLTALSEGRADDAEAMMHPDKGDCTNEIAQMIAFIDGRTVTAMVVEGYSVSTNVTEDGNVRQEQSTYKLTLSDDTSVRINATYLTSNSGEGFYSFEFVSE